MPSLYLGTHDGGPFGVDADLVVTGRTCVIGSSGSGKSYAVGVICEELCKNGIPFVVVDIEGEFTGLKEKYNAILVGEDAVSDLKWGTFDTAKLAALAHEAAPLILDLSETSEPLKKVDSFLKELYKVTTELRSPYLVVVEEADRFVPQAGSRLAIFGEIARRGRKRGMGLMICTQRPSLVDKNVLSQCSNQLIGRLVVENDLKSVAQFFPSRGLPKQLTSLQAGSFYAMGNFAFAGPAVVKIRERETKHGGFTPALAQRAAVSITDIVARLAGSSPQEEVAKELGLAPLLKAESVASLIKKRKSHGLFGREETVVGVTLVYRPLLEVAIRLRKGLLKKKQDIGYFVFDAVTGKQVDLRNGLATLPGVERLVGLSDTEVCVLKGVRVEKDSGTLDIANRLGFSEDVVKRALKVLEAHKLVKTSETQKKKSFRRAVSLPRLIFEDTRFGVDEVVVTPENRFEQKMGEKEIRGVLGGLLGNIIIDEIRSFLYPLFRVEVSLNERSRVLWIDGRTAKNVLP